MIRCDLPECSGKLWEKHGKLRCDFTGYFQFYLCLGLPFLPSCQLQTFFEKQAKKVKAGREMISFQTSQKTESLNQNEGENQKLSEKQQKQELIKQAEGRSTRATMKLLSEVDPLVSISREQTRFLGKEKVEISNLLKMRGTNQNYLQYSKPKGYQKNTLSSWRKFNSS